jgi:hypothetical protein
MAVERESGEALVDRLDIQLKVRGMSWWDLCRGEAEGWDDEDRISSATLAKIRAGSEELSAGVLRKIARRLTKRPVDEMLSALVRATTPSDGSS